MNTNTNEKPCLEKVKQGFSVSYKNKYLYSKYNPLAPIEKSIKDLIIPDETLVLVFSPVLGYGLDLLINKITSNSFLLLIEHDENLFNFSLDNPESKISNTNFDKNKSDYKLLKTEKDIIKLLNEKKFCNKITSCKRVIKINLSAILFEYENFYQKTFNLFTNYIAQFWKNRITLVKLGKLFSKNIFLNLSRISNSKQVILNSVSKPIFVFGASPCLDDTIKNLLLQKINFKNYFIIGVDSVLKSLEKYNICPDVIIAVESQLANEKAFIGTKDINYLLVSDLTSRPNINKYHNENISYIFTKYCDANFLDKIQTLKLNIPKFLPLGSVGLYAIELALKLRMNNTPIFFAGLDFSYITEKTHCNSSPANITKIITNNRINSLINVNSSYKFGVTEFNIDNQKFFSDKTLLNYAKQFSEIFSNANNLFNISQISIFDLINSNNKIKTISINEMKKILSANNYENINTKKIFTEKFSLESKSILKQYFLELITNLNQIKKYLINGNIEIEKLIELINQNDFLYLHFPDGNRTSSNISFLKRVRGEIDYFLKVLNRCLNQL